MDLPAFQDRPPESARLTSYDERHLVTYLRLLDADEEGVDWREVVVLIFGVDPEREPERASHRGCARRRAAPRGHAAVAASLRAAGGPLLQ